VTSRLAIPFARVELLGLQRSVRRAHRDSFELIDSIDNRARRVFSWRPLEMSSAQVAVLHVKLIMFLCVCGTQEHSGFLPRQAGSHSRGLPST
jgi:hypothetical protein